MYGDCVQVCVASIYGSVRVNEGERGDAVLSVSIGELEQALLVRQRKLGEHRRELERLIEKKPIVERNIRNTEIEIFDLEASIFVLRNREKDN